VIFQRALLILLSICAIWVILTLFVERAGPVHRETIGDQKVSGKVLVLYDPDPFYNLDQQVCVRFSEALAHHGYSVDILSVRAARTSYIEQYQMFVFCANTYNWAPDWALTAFIRKNRDVLRDKPAVAITLGSGSTSRSKRMLEDYINGTGASLLGSQTYWLMRPNDETRMDESNIDVAVDLANRFGDKIGVLVKSRF